MKINIKPKHLRKNWQPILVVVTAYIYMCCYNFEAAYLKAFNINPDYVDIDNRVLFRDTLKALVLVFLLVVVYEFLKHVLLNTLRKYGMPLEYIKSLFRLASLLLFFYTASFLSYSLINIFALIYLSIFIVSFIGFAIYKKTKVKPVISKSDPEPLEVVKTSDAKEKENGSINLGISFSFTIIILITLPIVITDWIGEGIASKTSTFDVINEQPHLVVIRAYSDKLVCKNFNYKTSKLGDSTVIIKIDANRISTTNYDLGTIAAKSAVYGRIGKEVPAAWHKTDIKFMFNPFLK